MKQAKRSTYFTAIILLFFCITTYVTSAAASSTHKHAKKTAQDDSAEVAAAAARAFPKQRAATGVSVFIFNPQIRLWGVYDADGNLIKTGRGSGGRDFCPDIHRRCHTPVGQFKVYEQQGAGCKSSKFPVGRGGAPMPYCSYFHGGFAVHGSFDVHSYNASHGCIRVYPHDAQWLQSVLHRGSTVIVEPY